MSKYDKLHKHLMNAIDELDEIEVKEDTPVITTATYKHSRTFTEKENFGLPVPRLEIRTYVQKHELLCVYYLVTNHFIGDIQATCINWTTVSGSRDAKPYMPHRDSKHMDHDGKTLLLPGYFVRDDTGECINYVDAEKQGLL